MDRFNDTIEALESVFAQTLKPHEVIISVDHNEELYESLESAVGSHQNPPAPRLKLVLNSGAQGLSETRNVGIRAASGDIVAFIDDDAVAEPNWLEHLTKAFHHQVKSPESGVTSIESHFSPDSRLVVAVGGRAIPPWYNGKRPSWFPEELDWIVGCIYKGLPLNGKETRNVLGCNMAFRRETFERAGTFRSEMGGIKRTPRGGEEAELCLRIKYEMSDPVILSFQIHP
jgi:glycosyltransferase involved in cell wall biosynthesis